MPQDWPLWPWVESQGLWRLLPDTGLGWPEACMLTLRQLGCNLLNSTQFWLDPSYMRVDASFLKAA